MATDTRPDLRLADASESEDAGEADVQAADEAEDIVATSDDAVAEEAQEPDMIETAATAHATSESPADTAGGPPAKRATKFMADLSRAMQAAAESARAETMARFEVEAKGVVEEIHSNATNEAADLRRKADDDVAAIREWSKAEVARIRDETEARIASRKSGLDFEVEQHTEGIEQRVQRVAAVVASFELEMADFFERLNGEQDPTRIATMAETMPDPPSLAEVVASIVPTLVPEAAPVAPSPDAEPTETDFAAAEAEAATFSGDLEGDEDDTTVQAETVDGEADENRAAPADQEPVANVELGSSQLVVSGLVSVANIANFKRSLTRTPGISRIAVASGPDGDFVFTVSHRLGSALSASVQALPGFDIQITAESDDAINVAAQDRDATD